MMPLSVQLEGRANTETARQLDEIHEALIGFAITKGYLPCPAKSTSDGTEDRDSSTEKCSGGKRHGLLPWVTLGLKPNDSWGHLFQYSVTPAFSHGKSADRFTTTSSPSITIKTRDSTGNLANLSNVDGIPVVVLSTGKNGYWSWTIDQSTQGTDSITANDDEDTNAAPVSDGKTFISRAPNNTNTGIGEFDDLVIWISPNILFNRMIAAGKLP